jgi:hypothetical protein
MPSISTYLRSLGNDGAVHNVRSALDARDHEDWLVAGLVHRLDRLDRDVVPRPAATASPTVAA